MSRERKHERRREEERRRAAQEEGAGEEEEGEEEEANRARPYREDGTMDAAHVRIQQRKEAEDMLHDRLMGHLGQLPTRRQTELARAGRPPIDAPPARDPSAPGSPPHSLARPPHYLYTPMRSPCTRLRLLGACYVRIAVSYHSLRNQRAARLLAGLRGEGNESKRCPHVSRGVMSQEISCLRTSHVAILRVSRVEVALGPLPRGSTTTPRSAVGQRLNCHASGGVCHATGVARSFVAPCKHSSTLRQSPCC